jgi:ribosomal protein S18 acetylase RimI-like enzyme
MSEYPLTPYQLPRADVSRAAAVLVDAFHDDPVWRSVFDDRVTPAQRRAAFEVPLVYCLRFGEVWATTKDLEGIAAWVPGRYAQMTVWRMLQSGALRAGLRMGRHAGGRLQPVFRPLDGDRAAHMGARPFVHLQVLGVAPAQQGRGLGGRLLRQLIARCDRESLPLYLETETERNVSFYTRFGFRVVKQITLPVIDLPMWEMVREPAPQTRSADL